ncbi:serine hydrolase [bacterium]|nr:serine hydrolase [bacterium]
MPKKRVRNTKGEYTTIRTKQGYLQLSRDAKIGYIGFGILAVLVVVCVSSLLILNDLFVPRSTTLISNHTASGQETLSSIPDALPTPTTQREDHIKIRIGNTVTTLQPDTSVYMQLLELAEQHNQPVQIGSNVTGVLSRTIILSQGVSLDIPKTLQRIRNMKLAEEIPEQSIDAVSQTVYPNDITDLTFPLLQHEIEAMATEWNGVIGLYVHDLTTGQTLSYNDHSVFSAASTMKIAILLYAYTQRTDFDPNTQKALRSMIIDSDNLAANDVLAYTLQGSGTLDAYYAVQRMNEFLQELGLRNTYLAIPFESYTYLTEVIGLSVYREDLQEGVAPYTRASPYARSTPAEMGYLLRLINSCSQGNGELLDRYPHTITVQRCQDMLDLLASNSDSSRLVSGIPQDIRIEHKSGWVLDTQADVGIVRTKAGDYIISLYVWGDENIFHDHSGQTAIAAFSHLVYSAYVPTQNEQ